MVAGAALAEPIAHCVQVEAPDTALKVPGAQSRQAPLKEEPWLGLKVPGEHGVQKSAEVSPGKLLYLPCGHCVQDVEPSLLQVPGAHWAHCAAPALLV